MSFLGNLVQQALPIVGGIFGGPLGAAAGTGLDSLLGGGAQSPQNTGVSQQTSNQIGTNFNNQSALANLLQQFLAQSSLPLQGQVNNTYSGALQGVNPQQIQSLISQLTSQQLPPELQQLIQQMNPQTQATQAQGNLSRQLQDAYGQATEQTTGRFGGVNPGEGPNQSLAESYLQQTGEAGASLQSQIAALQSQAAQNQFQATLQGLNQEQGSAATGLNAIFNLLSGGQNAANSSFSQPWQLGSLLQGLGGQLGNFAAGQAQNNQNYNQGLGLLGTQLGGLSGLFGGSNPQFGGGIGANSGFNFGYNPNFGGQTNNAGNAAGEQNVNLSGTFGGVSGALGGG